MLDLVGNPEDRFSRVAAHMVPDQMFCLSSAVSTDDKLVV